MPPVQPKVPPVMVMAIGAALAGAVCCAVAAALQHREAVSLRAAQAAGWRLLWSLARRPYWLAGMATLLLAAGLHGVALLNGPLAVVQPLGVSAVVFAVPVAALLRRHRVRPWELLAAGTVATGLCGLLLVAPSHPITIGSTGSVLALVVVTVLVMGVLTAVASRCQMVWRGLLLAAGAGIAFGVAAVALQVVLFDVKRTGLSGVLGLPAVAVISLAVLGVWLNQRAYRAGQVAVVLAVVTVADPAASVFAVASMMGEQFPADAVSLSLLVTSAAVTAGGIAWLARSAAHTALVQA